MPEASTFILCKIQRHHPMIHTRLCILQCLKAEREREKEGAIKAMVIPVQSCICQLNTSLQEGEKTTCITYTVPASGFCIYSNHSLQHELNFTSNFGGYFLSKALKRKERKKKKSKWGVCFLVWQSSNMI